MKFLDAISRRSLVSTLCFTTVAFGPSVAAADTIEVTSQAMTVGFGNGCTLPEAILAVNSGDDGFGCDFEDDGSSAFFIVVPDGDYEATEPLTFTASVEVFASTAATLHTGSEWGIGVTGSGNGTPRVVINGLSVRGADAPSVTVDGFYADGGATLVARNVSATNCNGAGILIDGATLEMDNTELMENGTGLQVLGGGNASLLANSVSSNTGDGVLVDASTVEIQQTFLNANGDDGVHVSGTGRAIIARSNLAGNAGSGARVLNETEIIAETGAEQLVVEGCLFQGNTGSGVLNTNGEIIVRGSQLSGNGNSGLRNELLEGGTNVTATAECNGCTIRDNSADFGGGIWNDTGTSSKIFISNSAVFDNFAFFDGGGAYSLGQPAFANSTFSGNFAFRDGGGMHATGNELTVWHVTLSDNQALGSGGGLFANASQPRIFFSVIAGNLAPSEPDVDGNQLHAFYALVGEAFDADDWASTDSSLFGVDAQLGALQNVDGVTWAHPPLSGSPVVDAIPAVDCQVAPMTDAVLEDQRGLGRPIGSGCDMGSIEQGQPGTLPRLEALNWTSSAQLSLNSQRRTEGSFGLNVGGSGFRVVNSPVVRGVPRVGPAVLLDFFVPTNQPNPYWLGAVQMYATCASANLYNVYLGQRELTGLPLGQFSTLSFDIPSNIKLALAQQGGCFFSVAVNTNATPKSPVLDNLRITPPL